MDYQRDRVYSHVREMEKINSPEGGGHQQCEFLFNDFQYFLRDPQQVYSHKHAYPLRICNREFPTSSFLIGANINWRYDSRIGIDQFVGSAVIEIRNTACDIQSMYDVISNSSWRPKPHADCEVTRTIPSVDQSLVFELSTLSQIHVAIQDEGEITRIAITNDLGLIEQVVDREHLPRASDKDYAPESELRDLLYVYSGIMQTIIDVHKNVVFDLGSPNLDLLKVWYLNPSIEDIRRDQILSGRQPPANMSDTEFSLFMDLLLGFEGYRDRAVAELGGKDQVFEQKHIFTTAQQKLFDRLVDYDRSTFGENKAGIGVMLLGPDQRRASSFVQDFARVSGRNVASITGIELETATELKGVGHLKEYFNRLLSKDDSEILVITEVDFLRKNPEMVIEEIDDGGDPEALIFVEALKELMAERPGLITFLCQSGSQQSLCDELFDRAVFSSRRAGFELPNEPHRRRLIIATLARTAFEYAVKKRQSQPCINNSQKIIKRLVAETRGMRADDVIAVVEDAKPLYGAMSDSLKLVDYVRSARKMTTNDSSQ